MRLSILPLKLLFSIAKATAHLCKVDVECNCRWGYKLACPWQHGYVAHQQDWQALRCHECYIETTSASYRFTVSESLPTVLAGLTYALPSIHEALVCRS